MANEGKTKIIWPIIGLFAANVVLGTCILFLRESRPSQTNRQQFVEAYEGVMSDIVAARHLTSDMNVVLRGNTILVRFFDYDDVELSYWDIESYLEESREESQDTNRVGVDFDIFDLMQLPDELRRKIEEREQVTEPPGSPFMRRIGKNASKSHNRHL